MPFVDPCLHIRDRIAQLRRERAALLAQGVSGLSPAEKEEHFAEIRELGERIRVLEEELAECEASPGANVAIWGVEHTQAIQFFEKQGSGRGADNSVPMVGRKPTVLRVYVDKTALPEFPSPGNISGTLEYSGPTGSSSTGPVNGPILARPAADIDRGVGNATLNFLLPAAACWGDVNVSVRVFDVEHPDERGFTSRPYTSLLRFLPRSVRMHGVLVRYTGVMPSLPPPSNREFLRTLDFTSRVYPVGEISITGFTVIEFGGSLANDTDTGCGTGWADLLERLQTMQNSRSDDIIYVALLPAGARDPDGPLGCGLRGGGVAATFEFEETTFAQEVGHALDRRHASPCGEPPNIDPAYPDDTGSIYEYGFDVSSMAVRSPAIYFDFMSYCRPRWVSPYTYSGIRDKLRTVMAARKAPTTERLLLHLRVVRDGVVQLRPSFHLPGVRKARPTHPTSITCDLLAGDGRVLATERCSMSDPYRDENEPVVDIWAAPLWHSDTRSVRVRRGERDLGTIELADPPRLKITSYDVVKGQKDQRHLRWSTRGGKEPPTFLVRYSNDGGETWRVLATDLTNAEYIVDLDNLPGGDACHLQVAASAGARTTTAQTDAFAVPVKARQAWIVDPSENLDVPRGTPVPLYGQGFSPDFGTAPFDEVTWTSNLDGLLGVGPRVIATDLSVGLHTVTLHVLEGTGGEAAVSALIRVSPADDMV